MSVSSESTPLSAWRPSPLEDPLSYPGRIPGDSYLLSDGHVALVGAEAMARRGLLTGREAILAVGSNAAPARLADKCGDDTVIPVIRVAVRDHAAVYSAHISRYGSSAATLHEEPGSSTDLFVTMLTPEQVAAVDATEGNYGRPQLSPGLVGGMPIEAPVTYYRSRWGPLHKDGRPIRLSAFASTSPLPAMSESEVLDAAALRLGYASGGAVSDAVRAGHIEAAHVRARLAEGL